MTTSSPGSSRASIAAIIASVAPQETVTSVSGSTAQAGYQRLVLARDGGAERRRPPGDGVLVDVVLDGRDGRGLELRRAGEIGEALGEVDGRVAQGQTRHVADDGLGEPPCLGRGARHRPSIMRPVGRAASLASLR